MRRNLLLLAMLTILAPPAHANGRRVDLDFTQIPLADALLMLADTGSVSVVTIGVPELKTDAKYKNVTWDKALADVVKRNQLAMTREGTVYLVADATWIAERKKAKRRAYKGPKVDLELRDADATALTVLAQRLGAKQKLTGGRAITQRLRRLPLDQALEVLALKTGATLEDAPAPPAQPKPCWLPGTTLPALRLVAIGKLGATRYAALVQGAQVAAVVKGDCVGDNLTVQDVPGSFVEFLDADGIGSIAIQLHH